MKENRNTNKGYTLVELLVATAILVIMLLEIYSVMANSTTIYRNGNYEVQLQTEAQQVILQLEDLMVDCNGSISYDEASKVLSISTNVVDYSGGAPTPVVYTVSYVPAGTAIVSGTTPSPFGQLAYQKTGMTTPIPLADYVEEFSVDMSGYTNDNVTLNIKLANEDYEYSASESIYLRNEIGSGGHGSADDTSGAKKFIDLKRYDKIKLEKYFDVKEDGYEYDYKEFYFKDTNGNKVFTTTEYNINESNGYELTVQGPYCKESEFDKEYGPYLIYATGTKKNILTGAVEDLDESKGLLISAHTDPVSWGFNDYSFFYLPGDEPSYKATSLTQFKGINIGKAKKVTYSYIVKPMTGYHNDFTTKTITTDSTAHGGYPSSQGATSDVIFFADPGQLGNWDLRKDSDGSLKQYQCRIDKFNNYIDATSNAVVCYNGGSVWNSGMCDNFIKTSDGGFLHDGNRFFVKVNIEWESPASHTEFKIYLYPTNKTLTDEQKDLLEDQTS